MHAVVGALVALEIARPHRRRLARRVDDVRGRAEHLRRADRRVDRVRQLARPRGQPQPVGRAAGRVRDRHAASAGWCCRWRPTSSGRRWSTRSAVPTGPPIPRCATHAGRRAAHDLLDEKLAAWAADIDLDKAVDLLLGAGVPAAPAYDARLTSAAPAVRRPRLLRAARPPGHRRARLPVACRSATPASTAGSAPRPRCSASTTTRSSPTLGLSDEEIAALEADDLIGTDSPRTLSEHHASDRPLRPLRRHRRRHPPHRAARRLDRPRARRRCTTSCPTSSASTATTCGWPAASASAIPATTPWPGFDGVMPVSIPKTYDEIPDAMYDADGAAARSSTSRASTPRCCTPTSAASGTATSCVSATASSSRSACAAYNDFLPTGAAPIPTGCSR